MDVSELPMKLVKQYKVKKSNYHIFRRNLEQLQIIYFGYVSLKA